ncbi:MAG: hypothetical protein FWE16_02330 [Firmicutes bacterium]|nr:hypothetical protein [Bacillota bacterium]
MVDVQKLEIYLAMMGCTNEYAIRGNANVGNASILHEEIWKIENLLYRSRCSGYAKAQIDIESSGKVKEMPKNDYGYIEVEKCRQALISAIQSSIKNHCWQNVLVVNILAKHSISVLRTFFGKMEQEFLNFENKLPKMQEELRLAENKIDDMFKQSKLSNDLRMIFSPTISMTMKSKFDDGLGNKKFITIESSDRKNIMFGEIGEACADLISEINYKNYLLDLFQGTCDGKNYFEIVKDFFANNIDKQNPKVRIANDDLIGWEQRTRTGKLVDIRDTIAHTNEVQVAIGLESLPHFFNDAKFLLRHLTFIKRETSVPVFIEYDFKIT